MSEVLFSGDISNLTSDEIETCFKGVPHFNITSETSLIDLLINNNICTSRREVREFLNAGSITINGNKVTDENMIINKNIAIDGKIIVIRRGKKKYFLGLIKQLNELAIFYYFLKENLKLDKTK